MGLLAHGRAVITMATHGQVQAAGCQGEASLERGKPGPFLVLSAPVSLSSWPAMWDHSPGSPLRVAVNFRKKTIPIVNIQ